MHHPDQPLVPVMGRRSHHSHALRRVVALALLTALVALLAVAMRQPTEPPRGTVAAVAAPAVAAATRTPVRSAPPRRLPAPTQAQDRLTWVGGAQQDVPASPDPELDPVGLPFDAFADALVDDFPGLTGEPPTPAHARDFMQYTMSMHARLQLTGDRSRLEIASLALFDRIGAARDTSDEHGRVVAAFASVVLGVDTAGEVVDFIRDSCPTSGATVSSVTRRWEANDRALSLACHEHYGTVELVASGPGIL